MRIAIGSGWSDSARRCQEQALGRHQEPFSTVRELALQQRNVLMAGAALDWTSLPRGSIIVDVGGGIGSTSMLLASAFSSSEGEDLGLKFIIQDRRVVVEMGEKVTCSFLL